DFLEPAATAAATRTAGRNGSGVPVHDRFLVGDHRWKCAHTDSPAGGLSDVSRSGAEWRNDDLPRVQRHGASDADGRADEVQYSMPALRRIRTRDERLSDVPW